MHQRHRLERIDGRDFNWRVVSIAPASGIAGTREGANSGPRSPGTGLVTGRSNFGFVSAGLTMALTFAVVANNAPSTAETARTIGALAIVNLGVGAPITAVGASSARRYPAVVGSPGLRITSWVGYGLALLDAVILLNLSWDRRSTAVKSSASGYSAPCRPQDLLLML